MGCLPVPQARTQLAHGAMLLNAALGAAVARSVEAEQRREDDHDRGGPQGEDGKVGRLPALEPVERAASP